MFGQLVQVIQFEFEFCSKQFKNFKGIKKIIVKTYLIINPLQIVKYY